METNKRVTSLAIDLIGIPADLAGDIHEIHEHFNRWIINEGNQGIKRSKEVFGYALSYLLGENPPLPKWLAPSRMVLGSPKILENIWSWIMVNPRQGLTILRYSDLFTAILDDENCLNAMSSITEGSSADKDTPYYEGILEIASTLATKLKVEIGPVPMFSKGPNGIAILSSHRDSIALHREGILDSVMNLGKAIVAVTPGIKESPGLSLDSEKSESIVRTFDSDYPIQNVTSGRVVFLAEKSAKIRVIAQGDYITQSTLKPIHDSLAGILRKLPEDWTFDQEGGKRWVQKKTVTAKWSASFDLSNATDRLPLDLQAKIIDRVLPGNLGALWAKVIGDRQFKYTLPSGKEGFVRYSVGQPMGFFSSFVSFALLHHCVVKYAFEKAHGRPGSNFYAIIGDDMVIFDQAAGNIYKDIIRSIGGTINLVKSRISTKGDITAEFAKAYFRNGVELTPFSLRAIRTASTNWANVPKLVNDLRHQLGIVIHARKLKKILQEYWPNEANILVQLLEVPTVLGGFGKPGHTPLVQILRGTSNTFRRYLAYRAYEAYRHMISISTDEIDTALYNVDGRNDQKLVLDPLMKLLRDRNASIGLQHVVTDRVSFLIWAMHVDTPLSSLIACVTLMTKELPTSLREKVRRPTVMWVRASADDKKSSESAIDGDQSVFYAYDALMAATA